MKPNMTQSLALPSCALKTRALQASAPKASCHAAAALFAATLLAGCASTSPAPDAATLMARAEQALGGTGAQTLQVTARGSGSTFGHCRLSTRKRSSLRPSAKKPSAAIDSRCRPWKR